MGRINRIVSAFNRGLITEDEAVTEIQRAVWSYQESAEN